MTIRSVERLEGRRMLAIVQPGEVLLEDGIVFIAGTDEADSVTLMAGGAGNLGGLDVTLNGAVTRFAAGTFDAIEFTAGASTDSFASALDLPCRIDGAETITCGGGNDTITATARDFQIDSGAGDDVIDVAGPGGDTDLDFLPASTILAGAGNDIVSVSVGEYSILAGDGDDLIRCNGRFIVERDPATITTFDNSTIHGGDGSDTIFSGEGIDAIYAGAGKDRIYLVGVNDTVTAGGGHDRAYASGVGALIAAGAGNDRVLASAGLTTVIGGDGDDYIDNARRATGGRGNDTLFADADDPSELVGGPGDDVFFTQTPFVDSVSGGAGHDTATADGNDLLDSIDTVL